MKVISALIAGLALSALPAQAATIFISPASTIVHLGDLLDVELQVSGLADGAAPSVGAYDIDVLYDPSSLDLSSAVFGDPVLGNQLDISGFGTIQSITQGVDTINLFELSLDLPADLDDFQAAAFTLVTLTFRAIAVGSSAITPSVLALGDSIGDPIAMDVRTASVTVLENGGTVSEPGSMLLVLVGLASTGLLRPKPRRTLIRDGRPKLG